MNPLSDLERLVAAIEHQGANIAPTYQEYMPIAFATANDCGEAGRTFFHRICRLSEKYVYEEADKLYDHALKRTSNWPTPSANTRGRTRILQTFKPLSHPHTHIRTHVRTCHPLSRIIRGPRSSSR